VKKLVVFCMALLFATVMCRGALCEGERPLKPVKEGAMKLGPRAEEMRKLLERMREINQQLRKAAAEARQSEEVKAAYEKVRELQQALEKARLNAEKLVDEIIIKENPGLANLVKERRDIEEKLRKIRGEVARKFIGPSGREMRPFPRR